MKKISTTLKIDLFLSKDYRWAIILLYFFMVLISSVNPFVASATETIQETVVVSGRVTDEKGEPLSGVTIAIKGTNRVVTSNTNGMYTFSRVPVKSTLVFRYLGFTSEEIEVTVSGVRNVALKISTQDLEDVVVVGYGTVQRGDVIGAIAEVDMQDLMEAPVGSFDEALAGRVAGVAVSSSDGQPGAGMNIVIRGVNSLTQSNSPLYVIDGFP